MTGCGRGPPATGYGWNLPKLMAGDHVYCPDVGRFLYRRDVLRVGADTACSSTRLGVQPTMLETGRLPLGGAHHV